MRPLSVPRTGRLRSWRAIALASVALLLAACGGGGDGGTPPAVIASVRLTPASLDLEPGQTSQVLAVPLDAAGVVIGGRAVSWGTSNSAVATVNAAGIVTAVADGVATVTATIEGRTANATVTVRTRVAAVSMTPTTLSLRVGGPTGQLTAEPRSSAGALLARTVQWNSTSTAVATVSQAGVVTAVSAGTTSITATVDGVVGTATVQVTQDPCSIVRALQFGQTASGTLSASDCRLGDNSAIQTYEFTLATRQKVEIEMTSSAVDPYVFLADASLNVIEEDDDGGIGLNARILRTLDPGRYIVIANTFAANSFGAYQLAVRPAPAACVTGRATTLPSTTDATLTSQACLQRDGSFEDRYDVQLTQPTVLRLRASSSAIAPFLVLTEQNEAVIDKTNAPRGGTAVLESSLAAGRYTVLVRGARNEVGAYRLVVEPAVNPCDVTRVLTLGQTVQESFAQGDCALADQTGGPVRFFERYGLVLTERTSVQVDMTSTAVDAYLLIQNAQTGAVVAENDDRAVDNRNSRIVADLPAGNYIVNATTYATGETGPFTLTIARVQQANVTIAVNPTTLALTPGQSATVTASVTGSTNTAVTWTSSAEGIATVSTSGQVRGIAAGTATITARAQADPARTATVAVTVSAAPGGGANLDVAAAYLVQVVQQLDGRVPLVAGRQAVARVFVRGSRAGLPAVPVRVRIQRGGTTLGTYTGTATPNTTVDEACCSANILIPADVIQTGIGFIAEVDPDNTVTETNESDNAFPLSGTPRALDVQEVTPFSVRLVPVRQNRSGATGAASETLFDIFRSIWPLRVINASVRQPLVIDYAIGTQNFNDWIRLVTDVEMVRQMEGGASYYYGLVRTTGRSGVLGLANGIPARTAIGVDEGSDFGPQLSRETFAHEMGHTLGLRHAPCGGAAGPDPNYPFPDGTMGSWGVDIPNNRIIAPSTFDIMSYCQPQWVSAYQYTKVLDFRRQNPQAVQASGPVGDALLVVGHIRASVLTVDPAFSVRMPTAVADPVGRYVIEAYDANETIVASHRFTPFSVNDAEANTEAFVVAMPLPVSEQRRVARLQVRDLAAGRVSVRYDAQRGDATLVGGAAIAASRAAGGAITATWTPANVPAVLVRDPASGEVLAIARRGELDVSQFARFSTLELHLSSGVRSEKLVMETATGAIRP